MSPEKPKIVRLAILGVALPVAFGVMIELACDLLKHVVRYFSANIYFEIQNNIWEEVKDSDT
jgi:hypothetical protein